MIAIAIAIKAEDGGPVFYKQRRCTRDNREFSILNLQWMKAIINSYRKCAVNHPTSCAVRTTNSFGCGFRHRSGYFRPVATA